MHQAVERATKSSERLQKEESAMRRILHIATTTTFLLVLLVALLPVLQRGVARAAGSNGTWTLTGTMNVARYRHSATLLQNGQVLVAAGEGSSGNFLASAELYDPSSGNWSLTGSLNNARLFHTATLLSNGQVLVDGGFGPFSTPENSAELYDPSSGSWTSTPPMNVARAFNTTTLLSNGQVLVSGGEVTVLNPTNTAELYDPGSNTWTLTGSMNNAHYGHTATLLSNGKVLLAGGDDSSNSVTNSAELYDPNTGTWSPTGSMNVARTAHTATLLPNGQVLVSGGVDSSSAPVISAELYDPSSGTWTLTGSMNMPHVYHTATLLSTGQVLVAGGYDNGSSGVTNSAELYDPSSGTWSLTASMNDFRTYHSATLLSSGQVLVAGGANSSGALSVSELYLLDNTPPVLSLPSNITVDGNSSGQANVTYSVTASDPDNPPNQLTLSCTDSAGHSYPTGTNVSATFHIGTTTVNCSASDPAGNTTTGNFTVTVKDVTPPVLNLPGNMTVNATSVRGAVVTFTATATDDDGTSPPVTCTPASGSLFSFGMTTVNCNATDQAGNTSTGSFTVTVQPTLTLSVQSVKAAEGSAAIRVVAKGKAYGTTNPLSANITWGDGSSSAGTITLNANGSYSVTGSHSYAEEGNYTLTVIVSDSSGNRSVTNSGTAIVSDAALKVNNITAPISGMTVTQKGVFTDADPNGTLSDYQATINWGDGTTSAATIGTNLGGKRFTTTGAHTYTTHGTYTETLTITDVGGSTVTTTITVTV